MIGQSKLGQLRARHYGLEKLPETVRIPALGNRREETVKPTETATVDDLAFALIALNEKATALYREIDALKSLQDQARKIGALGADIAGDAVVAAKGSK